MSLFFMLLVISLICSTWSFTFQDAARKAQENNAAINVLIAVGSNTYDNYRHQADAAHAYHVVLNHGIPSNHIVTMMYDDIANNTRNPTKWIIINKPNGTNVYKDLFIDYRGKDVTVQIFLDVLQGNATAVHGKGSGRVLQSGPNDHIFIFLVGHGAPGIFRFPNGKYLFADTLNELLIEMHQKKKFHKMVFYYEACESGSFFSYLLSPNVNVYAATAANSTQDSYACYWDNDRSAYIGDQFSVSWMENSDSTNLRKETIQTQYELVKKRTTRSNVQQYGAMELSTDSVSEYQGKKLSSSAEQSPSRVVPISSFAANSIDNGAVNSKDVPVFAEMNKLMTIRDLTKKEEIFKNLNKILEKRLNLINTVKAVFFKVAAKMHRQPRWDEVHVLKEYGCYRHIVNKVDEKCFEISKNEYAMQYLHKFVTLCEYDVDLALLDNIIEENCFGEKLEGVV